MSMIVIAPYNNNWPKEFQQIQASLAQVLDMLALRIDHIGSTAVPGLGAKDVIDIQITVRELSEAVKSALVNAGYQHRSQATRDHVPEGEDPTPSNWEKLMFYQPEGQRRANIHIRVVGKPNQIYPLLFRDYLRAHPKSAQTVERIKRELARYHPDDLEAYYDIKDPVYDLIWDAAQDWAKQVGWQPG